jgi:hypothetical protein
MRLLADGEISYEQRGRHRRILLSDLLASEQKMRRERRESLDRIAQEGRRLACTRRRLAAPHTR